MHDLSTLLVLHPGLKVGNFTVANKPSQQDAVLGFSELRAGSNWHFLIELTDGLGALDRGPHQCGWSSACA